jgi:hypothetical protein
MYSASAPSTSHQLTPMPSRFALRKGTYVFGIPPLASAAVAMCMVGSVSDDPPIFVR